MLTAKEGMMITREKREGETKTFIAAEVYLGCNDKLSDYYEITVDEAAAIVAAESETEG